MAKAPTMDEWAEKIGTIALNGFEYNGRTLKEWIDLMASGKLVVTPDNATNGDVIKAVFPNIIVEYGYGLAIGVDFGVGGERDLSRDWWNAPYKAGDTE